MKKKELKLFTDSGIDPKSGPSVLGLILAAPKAVAEAISIEGAIRCAVEASLGMSRERVEAMLAFKPPNLGLGVLDKG